MMDYCVETNCYKDLELIVLKILDNKRYRENKDFFDCDIKTIKKVIKDVDKLLNTYRDNCDGDKISNIKTNKKIIKKPLKKSSKK